MKRLRDPVMAKLVTARGGRKTPKERVWFNTTARTLWPRILNDSGKFETFEVEPFGGLPLPGKVTEATVRKTWKQLGTRAERDAALAKHEARMARPAPPEEPTEDDPDDPDAKPAGDPDKPRLGEDGEDAGRTSGDAIEAEAQRLKNEVSYNDLRKMAKELGVDTKGKEMTVARRVARKTIEG